jgi:hypothetical protein
MPRRIRHYQDRHSSPQDWRPNNPGIAFSTTETKPPAQGNGGMPLPRNPVPVLHPQSHSNAVGIFNIPLIILKQNKALARKKHPKNIGNII